MHLRRFIATGIFFDLIGHFKNKVRSILNGRRTVKKGSMRLNKAQSHHANLMICRKQRIINATVGGINTSFFIAGWIGLYDEWKKMILDYESVRCRACAAIHSRP